MDNDPFIMKSVDRAREWVDAFAKAMESEKEESSGLLATLCGFGSWEIMVFAIESMPPSACDEVASKEDVVRRHDFYLHVFICMHNIRPPIARYLTSHLSPSASYSFAAFSMEEAFAESNRLNSQAENDQGEELVHIPDPIRFFTSASLCGAVNVQGWCTALELLGWDIDPASIDVEADIGEPSFEAEDESLGTVPIYLSGIVRVPETEDDPAANLFMKACLGDFVQENGRVDAEAFLILWRDPQHKTIDGNDFCCIGVSYHLDDECFEDVLISIDCRSPDILFDLNSSIETLDGSDFDELDERLIDKERAMCNLLAVILSGQSPEDPPEGGWIMECQEDPDSGWGIVRAIDSEVTPSE